MFNIQTSKRQPRTSFNPRVMFAASERGAWFQFGDVSTLFQDTSATVSALNINDIVARVNDKSGNGNNITQSTLGNRPIIKQGLDGKLCLQFDGINDFLASTAPSAVISNGVTFFCEINVLSNPNSGSQPYEMAAIIGNGFGGSDRDIEFGFYTSSGNVFFRCYSEDSGNSYNTNGVESISLNRRYMIMMYALGNNSLMKTFNSSINLTGTNPLVSSSVNLVSFGVGAEPNFGRYLNAQISNIILVQGDKTGYWQDVQQWMAAN